MRSEGSEVETTRGRRKKGMKAGKWKGGECFQRRRKEERRGKVVSPIGSKDRVRGVKHEGGKGGGGIQRGSDEGKQGGGNWRRNEMRERNGYGK